jgi:hypothetical protein
MTQIKLRTLGGKGMTQAAWKYALKKEVAWENLIKIRKKREEAAKKNITLPKLKWMERD